MKPPNRYPIRALAMIGLAAIPFLWISVGSAQSPTAQIRLVRTLKTRKVDIHNPVGLAFSMNEHVFHVVESRAASQSPSADSDVVLITSRPAQIARTRIPVAIVDPINIAFDSLYNRLLFLLPRANLLFQVKAGPDGRLNLGTLIRFDARQFGLQDPQGMAVDPATGDLLILDSAVSAIVRVAGTPDGTYDGATVSRVDLQRLGSTGLRGIAVNPANGHLHVLDSVHQVLYEITAAGQSIAARDLASLNISDPQGMAFAPTGDLTDDPSKISLYLADSGLRSQPPSSGQILELSFDPPAEAEASTFQSTLVKTTDLAAISPPSPDSSGLTYVATIGRLLMSDSEVEETVSGITHFQGANLWELNLDGTVFRTTNVSSVPPVVLSITNEPTGVAWNSSNRHYYISSDNDLRVYDVNPGSDGLIGAGDTWTSFSTQGTGNQDVEGVACDPAHNRVFVVDGVNMEVYEYSTSGTPISHFDVEQFGVRDPESVEFNPDTGTLYILSNSSNRIIVETTPDGALLRTINVSASNSAAPAGLAIAPASDGSPVRNFYIVARGIDNNANPNIVDGKMYEMTAPSITPGNTFPTVDAGADQTVTISAGAILQGYVFDNTLPYSTLSQTWSKASGPGTVTFSDPSALITTAALSTAGNYVLRLTAHDGELVSIDEVNITVTGNNGELSTEARVAASADDAEESGSGSVSLTSSDLELVVDGTVTQKVGMRFNGLNIPPGATITNAYVRFTVYTASSGSTSLVLQGETVDNAAAFTTAPRNVSSRPRTAASVSWNPNPWTVIGASGADQQTPDIALVIQEIVSRPGWASGNSLAIIVTGTGQRVASSYDGSTTGAPLLHVEYIPPEGNRAPVANADAYSTAEDTPLAVAPGVLANDTDADGDAMTAVQNTGPANGGLTLNSNGSFTYTPAANFNGSDTFTYHANDGKTDSNVATVTITVTPVNDAPVANAQAVTTAEDAAKAITLTATDPENNPLTYTIVASPVNGSLSGIAPNLTYTPTPNYNGADSFTFKANDGTVDSAPAAVSITVTAVNDPPLANPQSVATTRDTAKAITLTGSDPDGNPLTYIVVTSPGNGALSGTPPNLTYTPTTGYTGSDSFTFKVNDGTADSALATVSITVTAVNDPPTATPQSVNTNEDTAKAITLTGSDPNGDPLTYSVVTGPAHGSLSGTAPNLTYTPAVNYNGPDTFTFKVNDGIVDSAPAAVSITVTAVNDPPVANPQSLNTNEDTAKAITLTGNDVDGNTLTYLVVATPAHGALSGAAPNLIYTPAANYNGPDSFTFKANDGTVDSAPATVSVTVAAVNDPPIANPQSVPVAEDAAQAITLTGSDIDGNPLTYGVVTTPAHGTLSGAAPNLIYMPAANYNGPDSFTFKANDGTVDSAPATVSITVAAVNDPPVANPQSVAVTQDTPRAITLTGTDVDGNPLTYAVVTVPTNGALSGAAPNLTYTPAAGYNGPDSFTFKANDGTADSAPATVSITVTPPVNQAPAVNAGPDKLIVYPNTVVLTATVTDDGLPKPPALTYKWSKVSGPGILTFVTPGEGPATSGLPFDTTIKFSKAGTYTLRLTGSDGSLASSDDVAVSVRKK